MGIIQDDLCHPSIPSTTLLSDLCKLPIRIAVVVYEHVVIINPRRACAARVTVVVHVSVCVSVYDYSRTIGYEAAYERYQQL